MQLGVHQNDSESDSKSFGYTDIRWQQTSNFGFLPNAEIPSSFLAVTLDLSTPQ